MEMPHVESVFHSSASVSSHMLGEGSEQGPKSEEGKGVERVERGRKRKKK